MTTTTLTADQSGDPDAAGYILASVAAAGPRERDFLIQIGSELEYVEWRGDQHARPWQVVRGYLGTAPATHSSGATVTLEPALAVGGVTVDNGVDTPTAVTTLVVSGADVSTPGEARFGGPLITVPLDLEPTDPAVVPLTINSELGTTNDLLDAFGSHAEVSITPDGALNISATAAYNGFGLVALTYRDATTGDMFSVQGFSGGVPLRINHAGYLIVETHAAPPDAALANGAMAFWFDQTNGAAKLMVKAKQADGTVRTGSVDLA